jgi:very-short-patch-repair endonuclease
MQGDGFMVGRARELRRNQTGAEARVWRALRDRRLGGLKFRRQHVIAGHIVDFVCIAARLVIEIDGATHDDVEADVIRTAAIERAGYAVIRFWNAYVYDRESAIVDMILDALRLSALPQSEKDRLDREFLFPAPSP